MCAGKIQNGCTPAVQQQKRIYTCLVSILVLLLLLRRDVHFCFLVEVVLLLIIFLLAAPLLLLVLVLLTTSALKQRDVPATVSSFYVSVVHTVMLRTSIADVVLGCFYFCH